MTAIIIHDNYNVQNISVNILYHIIVYFLRHRKRLVKYWIAIHIKESITMNT